MRVVVSIAIVLLVTGRTLLLLPATAQEASLRDLLPAAEAVGTDFVVIDDRSRTIAEQADAFANAGDAARRLAMWGWQENAFIVFQATTLTPTGAPAATLDISLTRFASPDGASQALAYFLDDRTAVLGQREAPVAAPLGDEARAVSGEVETGFDTTLYVRSGPLLVRISATTAAGATATAPEQIARGIIDRASGFWQPAAAIGSLAASLPESLLSLDSTCSRVGDEDELAMPAAMERFDGVPDATKSLAAMGWEEGVSRQFGCDARQPGQIGWVNIGVHRFRDAEAAASAVHVFAKSRGFVAGLRSEPPPVLGDSTAAIAGPAVNGAEYSLYLSDGPLLFRITGVAPAGDPRQDVTRIAAALLDPLATPQDVPPTPTPWVAPPATATPLPAPVAIVPTIAPLPTVTAIPTTISPPTATPVPTLAPSPLPTATSPPPPPTSTPYSLPTATSGAVPTPTPRVIHLPTPQGDG